MGTKKYTQTYQLVSQIFRHQWVREAIITKFDHVSRVSAQRDRTVTRWAAVLVRDVLPAFPGVGFGQWWCLGGYMGHVVSGHPKSWFVAMANYAYNPPNCLKKMLWLSMSTMCSWFFSMCRRVLQEIDLAKCTKEERNMSWHFITLHFLVGFRDCCWGSNPVSHSENILKVILVVHTSTLIMWLYLCFILKSTYIIFIIINMKTENHINTVAALYFRACHFVYFVHHDLIRFSVVITLLVGRVWWNFCETWPREFRIQ